MCVCVCEGGCKLLCVGLYSLLVVILWVVVRVLVSEGERVRGMGRRKLVCVCVCVCVRGGVSCCVWASTACL